MAVARFTVTSPLDVTEAFDRVVDLTNTPEWDRGISNPRQLTGSEPGLGARYEVTVTGFDGQPTTMVYEILEFERPNRMVMRGENSDVVALDVLVFASNADGCELDYDARLDLVSPSEGLTDEVLQKIFDKVASVPREGLASFLAA